MSEVISVTIPNTGKALTAAADFFLKLAGEASVSDNLKGENEPVKVETETETPPPVFNEEEVAEAKLDNLELDKSGLPWDARIHATTKTKLSDGTWKLKRKVDPALVTQVEAELRAMLANTSEQVTQDAPPPPPADEASAPPPPPAETTEEQAEPIVNFQQFMTAVHEKGIDSNLVTSQILLISGNSVNSLPMLATRPDLIPAVAAALGLE